MMLRACMRFRDLAETAARGADFFREEGETWEASPERAAQLADSKWGPLALPVEAEPMPVSEPDAAPGRKRRGRPTKAELLEEAASLGLEVPEGATNPEIAALIEGAR